MVAGWDPLAARFGAQTAGELHGAPIRFFALDEMGTPALHLANFGRKCTKLGLRPKNVHSTE